MSSPRFTGNTIDDTIVNAAIELKQRLAQERRKAFGGELNVDALERVAVVTTMLAVLRERWRELHPQPLGVDADDQETP